MKRIYEMTEDEMIALDDATINNMIDYECALEGIPMLPPHPGPEPTVGKVEPDMTVFNLFDVYFSDSSDAAKVLDAINGIGCIYRQEGWGDDARLVPLTVDSYNYPKISTCKMLSGETYINRKSAIESIKTVKGEWERAKRVYDEAYKQREGVISDIHGRIRLAKDNAYSRDCYRSEFRRYLELADQNATIAMNFLLKAKPDLKSDFPALVDELCPGYGIEG